MHNALIEARGLGFDCVQVFTKNQRQWAAAPLAPQAISDWRAHLQSTGIGPVVSHDSYLINLASPDGANREKSIALFRDEIERCETLAIPWLVTHPGAHLGQGEEEGLRRIVAGLDHVHRELPGYKTVTCLEITAGQGSGLGYKLEHLKFMIENARDPQRLAVCIDTAHALEAGYDLSNRKGARSFLDEIESVIGLDRVQVMHLNDSKTPRGSRVDRHEHLGQGHVGLEAFEVIVNHPKLKAIPKILETPKGPAPDGREWDTVNLETLRGLVKN